MLRTTLVTLRHAGRPMCLSELSQALSIDEATMEGMLDTLIARGRLQAKEPVAAGCQSCPIRSGCFIMRDGVARTYALVDGGASVSHQAGPRSLPPNGPHATGRTAQAAETGALTR